jgi:hypothetical protein
MKIIMKNTHISSIKEVEEFLQGNHKISFSISSKKERYELINNILLKFRYRKLSKKEKGLIKKYLIKLTGYTESHIKKLNKQWLDNKSKLVYTNTKNKNKFKKKYHPSDISLLIKTDSVHRCANGNATVKTMKREFEIFGKIEYKNISEISTSHLYNIRKDNRQYNSSEAMHYTKTQATQVSIGERRKPQPDGKCGYLRVDSVHQGDRDKEKGVYHINVVDEVTQWEIVGCVEGISEYFLEPLLIDLLKQFPYEIINFHSDNGSEYINKTVEKILNSLMIKQTKSQPRKSTHNALVEGKNGSVIRKHIGRNYIHKKYAKEINDFYKKYFNVYLNYHRVCAFPVDVVDQKGKIKRSYPKDNYMTPYDKLKLQKYINWKENISFEVLDKIAYDKSDNEFAEEMKQAKNKLFTSFKS